MLVKDKNFKLYLPYEKLVHRIEEMAEQINQDYSSNNLLLLGILNGSYMFMSELTKNIPLLCKISFIKISSYDKTESTGIVNELIGLNTDIKDKDVYIVEDIVDTGTTMNHLLGILREKSPRSIKIVSLFSKNENHNTPIDYCGFEIPNDFIIGFGLDYDGYGRNLKDIYVIDDNIN